MFMKWVMTVTAIGVLTALLEALLPEGGVRKTAMAVLGLVMLVSIAAPIVTLLASSSAPGVDIWTRR